ncbi:recombination mediator RecR [Cytophaga hutchinsonii]|jgi:recombination protein RecR|uniref:Recombination protein RecR n=1 Tax=Cytophaga hutchinsonii (strain ATCC 33406 / DSM 1761 / CIP 103989 / NBRC 15051 / NCIMB 9469 / D465) TaxID=269798 RepID=RECR_CYTH3|nr:recombination mediator RecR [Cytophaga hutchinsonii]Q11W94.1 RecName: Full=Recombination protein RecR [Cytophaga hutchinsonii ATCC 33406]ABG58322.1 recombination protein [Cytophaga hutchinsonii ATCC 33406]SFX52562.1 DNA replication and repair protein RecR [Cytophaga hutchinsonii ATCC 33406]
MNFPSKLLEDAVLEISKLPGIGKKTALRLVLHLLKKESKESESLANALLNARENIRYCKKCHTISDHELCAICTSNKRDKRVVCIVEDIRDVLAIENTNQYFGVYHVIGGVISPMERIGPDQLNINSLIERVITDTEIKEIILGLSPTMEGDTTAFFITKKLKSYPIKISTIARGIPFGGELEYMDEVTLGRSIATRTLFETKED